MRRVAIVGTSGSGKSTLAERLGGALGVPWTTLDALHWGPRWTPRPEFRDDVDRMTSAEAWVVDGNYSAVRDLVWGRADTLVWLDYPFPVVFSRLLRRTLSRSVSGVELWAGNTESLRMTFASRDSILLWAAQTHWKNRETFAADVLRYPHLDVRRLRRPRDADALWAAVTRGDNRR